jgi:hypothetical protein
MQAGAKEGRSPLARYRRARSVSLAGRAAVFAMLFVPRVSFPCYGPKSETRLIANSTTTRGEHDRPSSHGPQRLPELAVLGVPLFAGRGCAAADWLRHRPEATASKVCAGPAVSSKTLSPTESLS